MSLLQSSPSAEAHFETCVVMGVSYRVSDMDSAVDAVLRRAQSGRGGYACLAGVHGVITAQHRPELMNAFRQAWVNFPDGEPVAWMMRKLGAPQTTRVAGPDLMPAVIEHGQDRGVRHFLFGSTPDVLEQLEQRLLERAPGAQIVGTMSPPFRPLSDEEEARIVRKIRMTGANIVWVGLGLPKQDEWMCRNAERLGPCLALGVGAAFDFLSGTKKRAPAWMRARGLEWLHRMCSEPHRLGRRYMTTNSEFVVRASGTLIGQRQRSIARSLKGGR